MRRLFILVRENLTGESNYSLEYMRPRATACGLRVALQRPTTHQCVAVIREQDECSMDDHRLVKEDGTYNKSMPVFSTLSIWLISTLHIVGFGSDTMRENVAACSSEAYASPPVEDPF